MQQPGTRASAPACVPLDLRLLPWVRRLAADYAHDFAALEPFFAGNPAEAAAWAAAVARARAHPRDRAGLVAMLSAQLARREAPPAAVAALATLHDPASVAIVTGQQAGLFGGPLYSLLKALTAIQVARRVASDHGVPAVAVFWIDSEDHDWQEVAGTTLLDGEFVAHDIALPPPAGAGHLPVASLRLDESVSAAIDQVRQILPQTEFTGELLSSLATAYAPGRTMSEAFGRWLETWLGPLGLVVFDCADAAAKPLVSSVFRHELAHAGRTSALAAEAGAALEARGFHAQVSAHLDATALFHLDPERHPIKLVDGAFRFGTRQETAASLIAEAGDHPERFSPNVLLRPLVQDALFPTVAYVAGPSELAYLGQLRSVYADFGIPMPLVVPRATVTLLDAPTARFIERYQLALPSLQAQDESTLNHLLEAQLPPGVESSFQEAHRAVGEKMAALIAALPALDPTLEGAARSTLGKMEHDLRTLHAKIIHAAKRRDETLRRQFTRARATTFPHGHLQERTLCFLYLLNRYGPALIDVLDQALSPDGGYHCLLTV